MYNHFITSDNHPFTCGLYGGSFNPPHLGHVRCILEAASCCRTLILVISSGSRRSEIDVRVRYRWIYRLTSHLAHVKLFILEDDAGSKEAYTEEYWQQDADKVKAFAGQPIDAVSAAATTGRTASGPAVTLRPS